MRYNFFAVLLLTVVSTLAGCWMSSESPTKSLSEPAKERATPRQDRVGRQKELSVSDDPRRAYKGVFRNIDPSVNYVGDENCAQCHDALCHSFHEHPMGRSAILAGSDGLELMDPEAKNPFHVGPYTLSVEKHDTGMTHRMEVNLPDGESLAPLEIPVSVAVGSGTRGRSYLTIEGDTVWQSPISWFSTNSRWDVSPGFDIGNSTQRQVVSECLYCHVNSHEAIQGSFNRYRDPISKVQLAIGCERCHGPGELHSRERSALSQPVAKGEIDTSIVNPAHLSESLQMAICAQCHLSGKERVLRRGRSFTEFRPGLPIELFVTAFLASPDAPFRNAAVSHFDQSALSKCRSAMGKPLICTTCHDPHRVPDEDEEVGFYNTTCNACHETRACSATDSLRQTKNDSCIACHMPSDASSNIPHTSFTDHRILRQPEKLDPRKPIESTEVPLIPYGDPTIIGAPELERDLGIALSRFANRQPATSPFRSAALSNARSRLMISLQRWQDDIPAWIALGEAELNSGRVEQAVQAAQGALQAGGDREDVLAMMAIIAEATGDTEFSVQALDQLISLVPESQDYLAKRMRTSVAAADWNRAEKYCDALLKINPAHPSGHVVLAMVLYNKGKQTEGLSALETAKLLATTPQQRASFQKWFDGFVAYRSQRK
jgi:hypothetical protein